MTTDADTLNRIVDAVRTKRRFVLSSHVRPDGDGVGSSLGLCWLLRSLGKSAEVIVSDGVPPAYQKLPGSEAIRRVERIDAEYDAVFIIECSDIERPGIAGLENEFTVNIDHHATSEHFGTINWTPPTHGKTLWQVGTADRLAAEFRHGDEPRAYGLWDHYSKDFPNGVNFVIGKSKERTDWNFAQFPGSTWKIQFDVNEMPKGKVTLTLAIAGASGSSSVTASFAGCHSTGTRARVSFSSVLRQRAQAGRRCSPLSVDAAAGDRLFVRLFAARGLLRGRSLGALGLGRSHSRCHRATNEPPGHR